ncbi:MAG: hypothetical protein ACJ73S_08650 [Mycobacteriales bacterium]
MRPAARLLALASTAGLAIGAAVPWMPGLPRPVHFPYGDLFDGVSGHTVRFGHSMGAAILFGAALVLVGAVTGLRIPIVIGALTGLTMTVQWMVWTAIWRNHHHHLSTSPVNFKAGWWLTLGGVVLGIVAASLRQPRRQPTAHDQGVVPAERYENADTTP